MTKKTTRNKATKTNTEHKKPVILGPDGLPEPDLDTTIQEHFKKTFACFCPICHYPEAKLQLTKKGTYYVQCKECKIVLYLNHNISISLFRGMQQLFTNSPEVKEQLSNSIVESIPVDIE